MLMPSIYGKDLFEDLFDRSFGRPFAGFKADQMMRTDVKDTENGYEVTIDMPGVKKEDIKAELKDGNLTISAVSGTATMRKMKMEPISGESVTAAPAAEAFMSEKP